MFSLAPLVLLLLAVVGFLFQKDPAGAWQKLTDQMSYFLDKSAQKVVSNIAQKASQPNKDLLATIIARSPDNDKRANFVAAMIWILGARE